VPADRRASDRCKIQADEIQIVLHPSQKLFSIYDISKGGLAFEYSPIKDETPESVTVDILATDYDQPYLSKIACKTVYDIFTLMHGRSFKGGAMRIRGLKFIELTKEQKEKLYSLLKRCFSDTAQ
jgi:hypothetical protein